MSEVHGQGVMKDLTIITDWRTSEEALPDVAPGQEFERVIRPQYHVEIRRILVKNLRLKLLQIGAKEVAFARDAVRDEPPRGYRPLDPERDDIVVAPAGIDVRLVLHNDQILSAKPRAALLVRILKELP